MSKTELSISPPKAALLKLSKWQPHPCHKSWNHLWLLSFTSYLIHQQILLAWEYIQNLITSHHLHCYLLICAMIIISHLDHYLPSLTPSVLFQHSFKWSKIYLNEIEFVLPLIKIFQCLPISLKGKAAALTKSLQGPTTATFILRICDLISYNCVLPPSLWLDHSRFLLTGLCLRTRVLAVPSAWNAFPPDVTSFKFG